jgi:cytoskeletal protein RodZ
MEKLLAGFDPWGIVAICAVIIVIAIAVIVFCVIRMKGLKDEADFENEEQAESKSETSGSAEKTANNDGKVSDSKDAKVTEKENTAKENAAKQQTKTDTNNKTTKNTATTAKTTATSDNQNKTATADKKADDASKDDAKTAAKVYHISKRKDDGKWQVKFAGGSKAIKLFDTQAEAIEYAKKLADNQDARIVIHKEDGSFRRLTYNKNNKTN